MIEEPTEPPSSSLAQLSYHAALRALDGQERGLEELRARTGTLLAAASLVASFLGAQTIQRTNSLATIEALALIALAVSVGACTYVLLPKEGFIFSLNGIRLYETLYEYRDDDAEMQRRLAYWLEGYWSANEAKIGKLGTGSSRQRWAGSAAGLLDVGARRYDLGIVRSASPTPPPAPPAPPPDLGHPETKGGLGPLTR